MKNHIGIRASSAGKICTNKPFFNEAEFYKKAEECQEKVSKKLELERIFMF